MTINEVKNRTHGGKRGHRQSDEVGNEASPSDIAHLTSRLKSVTEDRWLLSRCFRRNQKLPWIIQCKFPDESIYQNFN